MDLDQETGDGLDRRDQGLGDSLLTYLPPDLCRAHARTLQHTSRLNQNKHVEYILNHPSLCPTVLSALAISRGNLSPFTHCSSKHVFKIALRE